MGLQSPQTTLNALYAARDELIAGKIKSYALGDRSITLIGLDKLETVIEKYESIVAASTPIVADLSGLNNLPPWPEG